MKTVVLDCEDLILSHIFINEDWFGKFRTVVQVFICIHVSYGSTNEIRNCMTV